MNTVYCPVTNNQIDGTTCLEIVLVADGMINERTLSPNIQWNEGQRNKCLLCKWHDDVETED